MRNDLGWIVFTRLDRNAIYRDTELCQEEKFETYEQADTFLELSHRQGGSARKYNGWIGPIPIIGVSDEGEAPFAGPRLEERLRFSDTDEEESFHEFFDNFWQDDAVDQIPRVIGELEQSGEIPGAPSSDLWGPPILTPNHHKKVQQRLRDLRLPDIECYLNEMWAFPVIEINARRRLGHINPDVSMGFRNRLRSAALDLQAAFCGVHPRHSAADSFWFWTSLQVHTHLAEFCKERLWDQRKYNDSLVESARRRFCRALGSYAYEVRSPERAKTAASRNEIVEQSSARPESAEPRPPRRQRAKKKSKRTVASRSRRVRHRALNAREPRQPSNRQTKEKFKPIATARSNQPKTHVAPDQKRPVKKSNHTKRKAKIQTSLGGNIERLRKECGWSFDDLALETGLDKKLILGHVNRGRGARPFTWKLYADAFTRRLERPVPVAELEISPAKYHQNTTEIPPARPDLPVTYKAE
jgi:hypothetical protein